ncbi:MAG TPA: hypothetical protein DIU07_04200, partial [Rhodobacteraceae bacterium]|nr:hypothetical protein [Paracoccaceae bacterium]
MLISSTLLNPGGYPKSLPEKSSSVTVLPPMSMIVSVPSSVTDTTAPAVRSSTSLSLATSKSLTLLSPV